jgi:anti-anti-sigma factor
MNFTVTISKREDNLYLVDLDGKLDTETCQDLQDKLHPLLVKETQGFVFDMKDLDYISSSGLGVLFMVRKFTDENEKKFLISNVRPQIKKVFDIVKALPSEVIFQSMEELDDYLDAIQQKEIEKKRGQ